MELIIEKGVLVKAIIEEPTDLVIPDTVKAIGDGALSYCDFLESVEIPDSVTNIGAKAFFECTNLKNVTIPDTTCIEKKAFDNCYALNIIHYRGKEYRNFKMGTGYEFFYANFPKNFYKAAAIEYDGGKKKAKSAAETKTLNVELAKQGFVMKGSTLTAYTGAGGEVIIPTAVTEIKADVFRKLSSLKSVLIPKSVKVIGDRAFCECSNLASVTLSEGLNVIGVSAFRDCLELRSLTIPKSVNNIGNRAFENCNGVKRGYQNWFNIEFLSDAPFKAQTSDYGSSPLSLFGSKVKTVQTSEAAPFSIFVYHYESKKLEQELILKMLKSRSSFSDAEAHFLRNKCKSQFKDIVGDICRAGKRNIGVFANLTKFVPIDAKSIDVYTSAAKDHNATNVLDYLSSESTRKITDTDRKKEATRRAAKVVKQKEKKAELEDTYGNFSVEGLRRIVKLRYGMVRVKFADGRSYQYECPFDVEVGDKVRVEGTRSKQVGVVTTINEGGKYGTRMLDAKMKQVVEAYKA